MEEKDKQTYSLEEILREVKEMDLPEAREDQADLEALLEESAPEEPLSRKAASPKEAAGPADEAEDEAEEKSTPAKEFFFWAQALTVVLTVLVCLNTFFLRISGVVGSSMYDTLEQGDQVIMRILGYSEPERGDIIVCTSDAFGGEALVKRVVALAGDRLDISEDGRVILNGEIISEPYIYETIAPTKHGDQTYPLTIGEGHVFVMGDNRNGSTDSRWKEVGEIECDRVVGKVLFRIWPLRKIGGVR